MSAKNGKPCASCGGHDWDKWGNCFPCSRERSRRWKADNPEKNKSITAKWRDDNPKKMQEHNKRWVELNRDKSNAVKRRWEKRNPDKARECHRSWAQRNPDKVIARAHRHNARRRGNGGSYTVEQWTALRNQYGNRCIYPGCERTDLEPDHVIPVSKGGSNDISNIQPLCLHHNRQKSDKVIDFRTKPGLFRWLQSKLLG